jgi:hypothetical protein
MANQPPPQSGGASARTVPVPDEILRLKGRGIVYKGDQRLGESGYDIIITPAHLRGHVFESGHEAKNKPDITGMLTDAFFHSQVLKDVLTLELEDGRRFDFRVLQPETNEIVAISWLRY